MVHLAGPHKNNDNVVNNCLNKFKNLIIEDFENNKRINSIININIFSIKKIILLLLFILLLFLLFLIMIK
jgi:hypothetical protein